jgi:hypothetical protein
MKIKSGSIPTGLSLPSSEVLETLSYDEVSRLVAGLNNQSDDVGSNIKKSGVIPRAPQFIDLTFGKSRKSDPTRGPQK